MRKLTDFELAVIGSVLAIVTDIHWVTWDIVHAARIDHFFTFTGLALGTLLTIWAWIRHRKTGSKPVQSNDDIDYRIELYLRGNSFKKLCDKEVALSYLADHKEKMSRKTKGKNHV